MEADWSYLLQGGLFVVLLAVNSVWDLRTRMIPDILCMSISLVGLLDFEPVRLFGILISIPLLLAALFFGGMGGGDIKFMAAAGLVLGFQKGFAALLLGLSAMLVFHVSYSFVQKRCKGNVPKSYPLVPFLSLGCLAAYFIL